MLHMSDEVPSDPPATDADLRRTYRRTTLAFAIAILSAIWLIFRPTYHSDSDEVAAKIATCIREAQHDHMAAGEIQKIKGACADLHRVRHEGATYR